jgi:hypothetical protein
MAGTSKPWFAPKRFGYGAGLPISWEGWAVLIIFLLGVVASAIMLHGPSRFVVVMALIAALIVIVASKTAGSWRWRRGEDL